MSKTFRINHRFWLLGVALLRWRKIAILICIFSFGMGAVLAQTSVFFNNGAVIAVKPGAVVDVKMQALTNNAGRIDNQSRIIVEGKLVNNDTITGGSDTASYIDLYGDWINNGVYSPGYSTVSLLGTNQLITGTSPTSFYSLFLSGTGLKKQTVDATVQNLLHLGNSELATDTNIMSVVNTSVNAITRDSGFVSSIGPGALERLTNSAGSYLFPVGSSLVPKRYRPIEIRPTTSRNQTLLVKLVNSDATLDSFDRNTSEEKICDINPFFYHEIKRRAGSDAVDIKFSYKPDEDGLWSNITHWQNIPQWEDAGSAVLNTGPVFNDITLTGWTNFNFSPFALMLLKPQIDSVITNVSCYGGRDGAISVSDPPLTGIPPFHYYWVETEDTTSTITGLYAGTYTLQISDSFGCPAVYHFTVEQPLPIVVTSTVKDASCKGLADGSICISVAGNFPPFTYAWFAYPGMDSCRLNLQAGNYVVSVTDSTGCTTTSSIAVDEPGQLIASAQPNHISCYGYSDGEGLLSVQGGTLPYTFIWSNGDTTQNADSLLAGTHTVTVTDFNGCTDTSRVVVIQPNPLIIQASDNDTISEGFSSQVEVIHKEGGTGLISYLWEPQSGLSDPNAIFSDANPGQTTTYTVTATDERGCFTTDTVTIVVDVNLYEFPDAFVPQGVNNIFKPEISPTVSVKELKIFNRWGQLLSSDPNGWDGRYKGELQPMDTYVYQSVILMPDGSNEKVAGDFILIW